MADTRCANSAYQLDVDEMTLDYLVYNTLKAHTDEWEPDYQTLKLLDDCHTHQAPTLLSILDATIHLFKTNHPDQAFSVSTDFYLKLLEFLLLFTHRRGGPSELSAASYQNARNAGQENIQRRFQCWQAYEQTQPTTKSDRDFLATRDRHFVPKWPSKDNLTWRYNVADHGKVPLVDLLPRFMEISAEISQSMQRGVSEIWEALGAEFMLQAAIEVVLAGTDSVFGSQIQSDALMACFGWGLPVRISEFLDELASEAPRVLAMEVKIHDILTSSKDDNSVGRASWTVQRLSAIDYLMQHIHTEGEERAGAQWDEERRQNSFVNVLREHPPHEFEGQVMEYMKSLFSLWPQLRGKPILLQIEEGHLDGIDENEFKTFMERVGGPEHEEHLNSIKIPGISKI